jgi:hypothetical protein
LAALVLNQAMSSGRSQISYTKCSLFTKSKFSKYSKVAYCLSWDSERPKKIFSEYGISLNPGILNQDFTVFL